jgi:hypothetical protein
LRCRLADLHQADLLRPSAHVWMEMAFTPNHRLDERGLQAIPPGRRANRNVLASLQPSLPPPIGAAAPNEEDEAKNEQRMLPVAFHRLAFSAAGGRRRGVGIALNPRPLPLKYGARRAPVPPPHGTPMKNIVYFDLETKKSAEEVGGWGHISQMGMSVGGIYSVSQGSYKIFGEKQVSDLIRELQRADLVVGFNNLRFDYEVLHGYTSFDLRQLPTLDMLVELQNELRHRLSLDSIATATFGVEKTAEGLQAIQWYREGKLLEIAEYCCYDVKITRLVHEYGVQNRQLHYHNKFGKKLTVPVKW